MSLDPRDWFLDTAERANDHTRLDDAHPDGQAWSTGNHARPLVHGATYFAELYERIEATRAGDLVLFTDWRGDPDEQLLGTPGSEVAEVLGRADQRGVDVRGLVWRSHTDRIRFSAEQNADLADELQESGAETLLDHRVRTGGSHHQKFVVIRHRDDPSRDIAYVGGIDLCHSRRDDARHLGDPQPQPMAPEYGATPPWHDVQLALTGPVVHDVETTFRERWEDPLPLTRDPLKKLRDRLVRRDTTPDPLPEQAPPPPPVEGGTHAVQLLRTYPDLRWGRDYTFAVGGERSVARGYAKALERARRLVYVEDQYLWSEDVATHFVDALRAHPDLHVIAVLPHHPDQSGVSAALQYVGRHRALARLHEAGQGRFAAYGPENHEGTPVYVHAKTCVMDDAWASIGSDNFNRRSWTHDSELSAAVIDTGDGGEGGDGAEGGGDGSAHSPYARRLRLTLAAEHLDRQIGPDAYPGDVSALETGRSPADLDDAVLLEAMADCVEPEAMFAAFADSARRLQEWHDDGRTGERPPGRLRPVDPDPMTRVQRALLTGPYRVLVDPDGRPRTLRRRHRF